MFRIICSLPCVKSSRRPFTFNGTNSRKGIMNGTIPLSTLHVAEKVLKTPHERLAHSTVPINSFSMFGVVRPEDLSGWKLFPLSIFHSVPPYTFYKLVIFYWYCSLSYKNIAHYNITYTHTCKTHTIYIFVILFIFSFVRKTCSFALLVIL